jgi:hypothetical protein
LESRFSFLVQTLFALQGSTQINGSYYSLHPLSGASLLSLTFINVKPQKRDALFASPRQQSKIIDESESLDWVQERLGLQDEHSNELARRFPEAHTSRVEEQLQPMLDRLQQRVGLIDEELGELVRRQPTILNLSIQDQLQDRLQLDSESLPRSLLRLTPMVGGLAQLLGSNMKENFEPTLVWLQGKLNLDDAGLRKLVEKYPALLGFESHKERVAWLQKRLLLEDDDLSKLVQFLDIALKTTSNPSSRGSKQGLNWMIWASASWSRHCRFGFFFPGLPFSDCYPFHFLMVSFGMNALNDSFLFAQIVCCNEKAALATTNCPFSKQLKDAVGFCFFGKIGRFGRYNKRKRLDTSSGLYDSL